MDNYISGLRKKDSTSFISKINFLSSSNEQVPEVSDTEVHIEYKEPSLFRKLMRWRRKEQVEELNEDLTEEEMSKLEAMEEEIDAIEDEETELEDVEEELEGRRQTILSRLFQKMSVFRSRQRHPDEFYEEDFDVEEMEEKELINEDLKEVLKITHTWLNHLSPVKKKSFKESDDFIRYKEILLKFGLVKEKGLEEETKIGNEPVEEIVIKEIEEQPVKSTPKKTTSKIVKKKK